MMTPVDDSSASHFEDMEEAALVATYPSVYSRLMLGHEPYDWQAMVMDWMAPAEARGLACTCNESGKTSHLVRDLILWHMDTEPGSLTVTTAGVNRQIGEQLYPYLQEACKSLAGWKVTLGNKYRVTAPNGSRCISFATDDPNLAEGFHAPDRGTDPWEEWRPPADWDVDFNSIDRKYTSFMLIVDEAKSVPVGIFRAIQRMNPHRLLITSSAPEEPSGFFVECFTNRQEWFLRQGEDPSDPSNYNIVGGMAEFPYTGFENCPHLYNSPKYVADANLECQQFGENSAFYMSMYRGLIPQEGSNMLFRMGKVDECMSRLGIRKYGTGSVRAAIDFSNGGDEIVLYIANGNDPRLDYRSKERNAPLLATRLIDRFKQNQLRPEWIVGDDTGMGDPVIDILHSRGWPICRLNMNDPPRDKTKYKNIRAEILYEFASRINCGEIFLPKDQLLRKQLSWHKYRTDEHKRIAIEPKEKMPSSPDRVDTLAMLFYGTPRAVAYREVQERQNRSLSPTLPATPRTSFETYGDEKEDESGYGMYY